MLLRADGLCATQAYLKYCVLGIVWHDEAEVGPIFLEVVKF